MLRISAQWLTATNKCKIPEFFIISTSQLFSLSFWIVTNKEINPLTYQKEIYLIWYKQWISGITITRYAQRTIALPTSPRGCDIYVVKKKCIQNLPARLSNWACSLQRNNNFLRTKASHYCRYLEGKFIPVLHNMGFQRQHFSWHYNNIFFFYGKNNNILLLIVNISQENW
jgi:hypothetical protein